MSAEWFLLWLAGGILAAGCYGVAAMLHEGGHALFGRLAGGTCLWIRLGRFLWVPGGGVFVRVKGKFWKPEKKRLSEIGNFGIVYQKGPSIGAGECVISCPGQRSLLWAALGGPAANLVSAAAVNAVWNCGKGLGKEMTLPVGMAFLLFLFCSLLMAFLSLFYRRDGEENDGSMAKKLYQSREFCTKLQRAQQRDLLRLEFGLVEEMF